MFEFKYKITDADIKSVNKKLMWTYFIPYIVVSILGLGAGIAATVQRARTELLVLGILLIVLSAILTVCSILLLVAPKNFVVSALITSDETERTVRIGDGNITVSTEGQDDIKIAVTELYKIKNNKTYISAYIDKDRVLLIKDAEANGKSLTEVFEYMTGIKNSVKPDPAAQTKENTQAPATDKETSTKTDAEPPATEEKANAEADAEPSVTEESAGE